MLAWYFIDDDRLDRICKGGLMEKKERPQERYDKANMAMVGAKYKKEFIANFKKACKKLGISQSDVFRKAMLETIEKAK